MPIMAQRKTTLDAQIFNNWRLQAPELGDRIDIALQGLKTMHFVLTPDFWIVVDAANYDAPILAWMDFKIADRENLHNPIACTLNYYHFAASAIRARSLDAVNEYFSNNITNNHTAEIIPMR